MPTLNMKEGEYLLIGETVTVHFDYKTGRNEMLIAIDAPDNVTILRSKPYEQSVAALAAAGDPEARTRHDVLKADRLLARRRSYAGRARRDEQERRMAAGEIKRYNG